MSKELDLWRFVYSRLKDSEPVILLVVAESAGSSPGRAGYKMAVASDGELIGSIGGGVMEVRLVEQTKLISEISNLKSEIFQQVHQNNSPHSSGMICSGKQTVIIRKLFPTDLVTVQQIIECLTKRDRVLFEISNLRFEIIQNTEENAGVDFTKPTETDFVYRERLGHKHELFIIGGGHCALALSELMSKINFRISIFDDRPELNTLAKNEFADEITIIDSYDDIASYIPNGDNVYVVVMTLGYSSDAVVIRRLIDHDVKYTGILGSRAKMATLMRELQKEGFDADKLTQIRTPIGLPINSRTPEEIAVSIAAEIIAVKNA